MSKRGLIAGAAVVVALDQAVKAIVRRDVPAGSVRELLPGVDLVHTKNSGVSFGFLGDAPIWVVALVSTLALALVITLLLRTIPGRAGTAAAALIIGGAVGNLIDRIAIGSVTDFLDLPLLPPCNIADIAITFGAITMALALLTLELGERKAADSNDPSQGTA